MELYIRRFGPIEEARMDFGDLTFLIGPQASGKSLSLELLKLLTDRQHIISTLRNYNYILDKRNPRNILECYFGDGLSQLFRADTAVTLDGRPFSSADLSQTLIALPASGRPDEAVFYVPAQRILSIAEGRPRNFMEFDTSTPYVLRRFSETLRVFLQGGLGNPDTLFPMRNRLKAVVRKDIQSSIFHSGAVLLDASSGQRRMKLEVDGLSIPFMAWSAGQKEFMPLLLAIYCLSGPPSGVIRRENYRLVIIEEPEMGLHPRAILSVLLELLELVQSGFRVVVSTHSSTFLEFVWVLNRTQTLSPERFRTAMCSLFGLPTGGEWAGQLFDGLPRKSVHTYYTGHQTADGRVVFKDISSLDVFDDNDDVAEWGGLSSFAGRASEIVSNYGE